MDALYNLFDFLIHPTFWDPNNPPLKVNVNAKTIGLIAAILGALGLLLLLLVGLPAVFLIGAATTVLGVEVPGTTHPGILVVALIGIIIAIVSAVLWTWGGYQMYQEKPEGRSMVVVALAIGFLGSLVQNIGLAAYGGWIFNLIVNAIIYYFVMIARFPSEAPLTTAAAPPPPPSAPPQA